jgi:hypothetical protein
MITIRALCPLVISHSCFVIFMLLLAELIE